MRIRSRVTAGQESVPIAMLAGCIVVAGLLASCAKEDPSTDVNLTPVTFPNGTRMTAEAVHGDFEMARGMMFRTSLPADRGMLFTHPKEAKYQYWMFQTKIPLDIIWMDREHKIVEISPNTPPCTGGAGDCPKYGGNQPSSFVLEVNAGVAAKNNLKPGDLIDF
ncbi:MAG TPA: DUF192 domain-containing protein [Bryobacteraceae bacterium]|nr:DUF192 domain-containing protein [Bryobacteraceae bacterium]